MKSIVCRMLLVGVGVFSLVGSFSIQANADAGGGDQDRAETPIALANPQISEELLNSLPESILDDGDIWVDPDILPNTPFLLANADGELSVAPGQTSGQMEAAEEVLSADSSPSAARCRTNFSLTPP